MAPSPLKAEDVMKKFKLDDEARRKLVLASSSFVEDTRYNLPVQPF